MVRLGRVQWRQATWREAKSKEAGAWQDQLWAKDHFDREVEIERGLRERERQTGVMRQICEKKFSISVRTAPNSE